MMRMQLTGRIHYLDAARALLMLLGIPYHVALIYVLNNHWAFAISSDSSPGLSYLAKALHAFRMPAFFVLAGYFAMMILERKGAGPWLRGRAVKLIVPFVAAILLLNPISLITQPDDGVLLLRTMGDHWIAHLWFLPALLCMSAFLALMKSTPMLRWYQALTDWVVREPMLGVPLVLFLATGVFGVGSMLNSRLSDNFVLEAVLPGAVSSMPFLLLGAAMRSNRQVMEFMSRCSWVSFVFTMLPLLFLLNTAWGAWYVNVARIFALTLTAVGMCRVVLTLCRLLLDRPSRSIKRIVDASFTMYLVHFPIFNLLFLLLGPADLPVWVEYPLLVLTVAFASYGVHALIARSAVLLFMFNGAPLSRHQAATRVV